MKSVYFFLFYLISCFHVGAQSFKEIHELDFLKEGRVGQLLEKSKIASNIDSSYKFTTNALKLYRKQKDSSLYPYIYYRLGHIHTVLNQLDSSRYYFNKAIALYPKGAKSELLAYNYSYLGVLDYWKLDFDAAIAYYLKTIETATTEKTKVRIKINCAGLYVETGRDSLARIFVNEVFDYYKNHTKEGLNHPDLINNYSSLAKLETKLENQLAAINKKIAIIDATTYPNESEKMYQKILGVSGRGDIYLYAKPRYFNNAFSDFKYSIKYAKKFGFKEQLIRNYVQMSVAFNFYKDYKQSLIYLDSIKDYHDYKWVVKSIDSLKFQGFYHQKQYDSAFYYARNIIKTLETDLKDLETNGYIEYGKKYQTNKSLQENKLLLKENQIKELEVSKQKKARNFLIILVVLIIITLAFTYAQLRIKKRNAIFLSKQNTVISEQKLELEKSNANKQRLFGIIAHDLINPFNAILGYTQLLEEDYDSFSEEQRKQFIETINKYANNNYNLTRTLLDWAKVQQDKLVVNKTKLNCKTIVKNALQPYQVLADKKEIAVITNIPEDITLEADQNMMQTVIGNLFVNAIKFTPHEGVIKLHVEKNSDGTIKLEIEDNGIGMTQEQLNNIFNITKISTRQGTNHEKGNGLGLILCKELMELQQGTLQLFSQLNKGSKAIVTI